LNKWKSCVTTFTVSKNILSGISQIHNMFSLPNCKGTFKC
jgi:hypothetical protein